MAIPAIDATVSGASANSYGTLAEAITYFEIRPGSRPFFEINVEEQRAALLFAVILIDREVYWGQKAETTQALQFPRTRMTTIPVKVKHAQFEQALHLVDGGYLKQLQFIEAQSSGLREVSAGGVRTRFQPFHSDAFPAWRLAPQARQLLTGYIESGAMIGRA